MPVDDADPTAELPPVVDHRRHRTVTSVLAHCGVAILLAFPAMIVVAFAFAMAVR